MDRRTLGMTIVSFLLYPVCFAQNRPIAPDERKQSKSRADRDLLQIPAQSR
jgi:hypothetical protein